jgi:hypothetical protein
MTTTREPATINRVADYFQRPLPEIPDSDFDRQAMYSESILQAVRAMRGLLGHADSSNARAAAQELLLLERTPLRHHRGISGCREKPIPKWKLDQESMECFNDPGPPSPQQLETAAIEAHAKEAQAELRKAEEAKPRNERKHVHSAAGRATVLRCLKHWNVTAQSIPVGTFWWEYLNRSVPAKVVVRRTPNAKPASASPAAIPRRVDPTVVADWNVDFTPQFD